MAFLQCVFWDDVINQTVLRIVCCIHKRDTGASFLYSLQVLAEGGLIDLKCPWIKQGIKKERNKRKTKGESIVIYIGVYVYILKKKSSTGLECSTLAKNLKLSLCHPRYPILQTRLPQKIIMIHVKSLNNILCKFIFVILEYYTI